MSVIPGLGTLLKVATAPPPAVPTLIAQRVSLDGPEQTVGTAETTNLDSTWKTFRPTLADGGNMSGTLQFDPQDPSHIILQDLVNDPPQAGATFTVQFKDAAATTATFNGILTKLKPTGIEVESNVECEFEIKVNGIITWAAGTTLERAAARQERDTYAQS